MNQYHESRKINIQEKKSHSSNFKSLINSFITDVLVFIAAIVTVVTMFIVIYIITVV